VIDAALAPTVHLRADRERALLDITDVARFGIEAGQVTVEPDDGAEPVALEAWRDGLVAALALAQHGRFALHANLIEVAGTPVAVAGLRGAGKTTTALRLAQRGGRILGDDVVRLDPAGQTVRYATTGRPMHVTPAAAATLGLDVSRAERVAAGAEKLVLDPIPAATGVLGAVVTLEVGGDSFEHRRLSGTEAVRAVHESAYRIRILRRIWEAELFEWAVAVAAAVPVHLVRRPAEGWSGDEVAAALEAVAAATGGGVGSNHAGR
jgi:hypothetical protein